MKHTREFLNLKVGFWDRIRETCGVRTDLELLQKLSRV